MTSKRARELAARAWKCSGSANADQAAIDEFARILLAVSNDLEWQLGLKRREIVGLKLQIRNLIASIEKLSKPEKRLHRCGRRS